ncbi:MAG: cob(I)yrinic acid a,c-diamide adenosyltransferase [Bacilli bacterium]|nr:cob(I)yrinic acid a,c-diamide adenosyltransferase [Bacilli bacterium]MDD4076488.1 cob(I)yrinic acid a,c-diamide adenosyltransferase [Bacilli bacterium]MDD4387761.1 cob(I)yrinic acid a,c-diamide adenosyltransferase [Bacilli bacterium]
MKIYTKRGDDMKTDVIGHRVYKDDTIIECLGTIDELSVSIMIAAHHLMDHQIKEDLLMLVRSLRDFSVALLRIEEAVVTADTVANIEKSIDYYQNKLSPLIDFVLPGETLAGSYLHLSRTIARRLERRLITHGRKVNINKYIIQYANRLSDLLFVIARYTEEKYAS